MKRELRLFFTALAYFTRIPCAAFGGHEEHDLNHAAKYFPLVGIVVGMVAALVYLVVHLKLPQELAVLASMAATLWLTGAFHEDGLTDAVDGLGGGWTQEQALTIMRDSRIGSFGAAALIMMLLAKFEALAHLAPLLLPAILVAGHALSRFCGVVLIYTQSYVRESGKAKPLVKQLSLAQLVLAALFGLAPLALLATQMVWSMVLLALVPVALAWWWFSRMLVRRLGGYTGDCLGAMQQLCELAFYLGMAGVVGVGA